VTTLTVILANYNHARYLPAALGSLLRQTRPADELIVIDDASTDESVSVISEILANVPYARLERNQSNIGCLASHNRVLKFARGDIIHLAAADDIYYSTLFDTGLKLLAQHPPAGLFSARSDLTDADGRNLGLFDTPCPLAEPGFLSPEDAARVLMRDDSWFMGNVSLYRRDYFLSEGAFTEELGSFGDGYMARVLALKYGACFTPQTLGAWRRLDTGLAMSHVRNTAAVPAMIADVQRRMTASGSPFPLGYAKRWRGRHLFGVYRAAANANRADTTGLRHLLAAAQDALRLTVLFVRLRPWDIAPVLRRWFGAVFGSWPQRHTQHRA
jgi:hypothetical protein